MSGISVQSILAEKCVEGRFNAANSVLFFALEVKTTATHVRYLS